MKIAGVGGGGGCQTKVRTFLCCERIRFCLSHPMIVYISIKIYIYKILAEWAHSNESFRIMLQKETTTQCN